MQYIDSMCISKMKQQIGKNFECLDILTIHCSFFLRYLMFLVLICFLNMQVRLKSEKNSYSKNSVPLSTAGAVVLWRIFSFSDLNHLIKKKKKKVDFGILSFTGASLWVPGYCLSIISFTAFTRVDLEGFDCPFGVLLPKAVRFLAFEMLWTHNSSHCHCLLWKLWAGSSI